MHGVYSCDLLVYRPIRDVLMQHVIGSIFWYFGYLDRFIRVSMHLIMDLAETG
jgi:hypothetical protein